MRGTNLPRSDRLASCARSWQTLCAVEATGALILDLPPGSPNSNAAEMAFARIKVIAKKTAARIVAEL
ncbi:MAG: IS630 family transposase, partial [Alphaproteobacteria bacterium]